MKRLASVILLLAAGAVFWGCSSSNDNSPLFDPVTGKHPANWIESHWLEFRKNNDQCVQCHGSFTVSAQSGGISGVSCFSANIGAQICHVDGPAGHPVGWGAASQHGRSGAMAAPAVSAGFAYCSRCHGSLYSNGAARSCLSCHTRAPHPDAPWHGTTASGTNHVFTDPGNAPECAKCHLNGANSAIQPTTPAPAGTAPGCFNSTLCHGTDVSHPTGWSDPNSPNFHGPTAKAASSPSGGFGYCQRCHGTNYQGVGAAVSCFSASVGAFTCHNGGQPAVTPHSPAPWHGTHTHTNTDTTNAIFCAACHTNGANSTRQPATPAAPGTPAGCFNNTLCHANDVSPPHPVGGLYLPASQHGADAINKNNNGKGLNTCQPCHATPSTGANPRFNVPRGATLTAGCETCHTALTAHPTPWLVGRGTTQGATNQLRHSALASLATAGTAVTNYCTLCHGANLDGAGGVAPSCVSGTTRLNIAGVGAVCHFNAVAVKDVSTGLFNIQTGCVSCHGNPPVGTSYPNRDFQHGEHQFLNVSCATCHSGAGYATALHANGTANVVLSATFQAKSGGVASYNATTGACSNVSCHGGQVTPPWPTGVINVSTDCLLCHAYGTTQYNSPSSGPLTHHGLFTTTCTECHDTTKLAVNHFTNLQTTAMEGPASGTISDALNYDPATRTCLFTCHIGNQVHDRSMVWQ
ncbi:CxxxxCH/CxxCH domain-containing protein [Geobacter sp.]|uniref:CxxxxCH/CxxCH domain c-type cytochrome n=1 Tax=Geobacter sp. TaxID=46610 RepID=UPI00261C4F9D|nr:CxxxxCH/CxxCH domain-containing protein [Geobacter sp.]